MSRLNMGSQSISGESEGFGDYRYQKALKQISKLINVNRQIKLQSERQRELSEQLQSRLQQSMEENSQLQTNIQLLSNEYENLSRQYQKLQQQYVALQDYCNKAQYQQQKVQQQRRQYQESNHAQTKSKEQLHKQHLQEIQQISGTFHNQMNQLAQQLNHKEALIEQLQSKITDFNQVQYMLVETRLKEDKLTSEIQSLKQENLQLNEKISELIQEISDLQERVNNKKADEQLTNKLKINQDWIKCLNEQNYALKQKLLEEEYKKEKQKCNQTIFHDLIQHHSSNIHHSSNMPNYNHHSSNMPNYNSIILPNNPANYNLASNHGANQLLMRQYVKQVQKKAKKQQEQKQKLTQKITKTTQKMAKLKITNKELETQNSTLQKQVNLLIMKVNGYQQLTQRQQTQIQLMIEQYHKEMDKLIIINHPNHSNYNGRNSSRSMVDQVQLNQSRTGNDNKELQLQAVIDALKIEINRLQEQLHACSDQEHRHFQAEQDLNRQLQTLKAELQQKYTLIQFLEHKISALEQQRTQIIRTCQDLNNQLSSYQPSSPISKNNTLYQQTSKDNIFYHQQPQKQSLPEQTPPQNMSLLKTLSVNQNGSKVFVINGKKYQTVVLKNSQNQQAKQETVNGVNIHKTVRPISSPRTNQHWINAQRA